VFRFAAPCAGNACKHFDGQDCGLVATHRANPAQGDKRFAGLFDPR